jgi:outer membrane protein OmpA-like peptidoglycan-associated protein
MSKTGQGAIVGTGGGAALGAIIGGIAGNAGIGTAIGAAVGAGTGAIIGNRMDKVKKQAQKELQDAQVETVKDNNGLTAVKVTFNSGILFDTNKSDLKQASKNELSNFASKMSDMQDTDITIYGHTDNTGSDAVNERLSNERAQSVANYLKNCGIASSRMTTEGKSYSMPVADNSTKEGRAQNRRVEIYITANQKMIEAAENGTLQ